MDLSGQDVLVIGAKRSGLAACELLVKQGARVRVMDSQPLSLEEIATFVSLGVSVLKQEESLLFIDGKNPELVVLSPGVPLDISLVATAKKHGIPVIGEVELASYFLKGPIIGITGSNGKTTTTALTGHLLKACGIPNQVGGNIGTAVTSLVETSSDQKWNVLELSSFQLESIYRFHAEIAVCLNLTPDHLDRHYTFEAYVDAKARLFETQRKGDSAVLNYDDRVCRTFVRRSKAEVHWFSSTQKVPTGVYQDGNELFFNNRLLMKSWQIKLRGRHNLENVMAASMAAILAGAPIEQLGAAVESFPGVEHRIEFVRELNNVKYYNDSKATNVDATLKAIDAFAYGLWLILGGKDKGSDYTPLIEPLEERAKAVLLIGAEPYEHAAGPIIRETLQGRVRIVECGTLQKAVEYAHGHSEPGDTVLLSPACASFDQFQNYEERGRAFKQLVEQLS